MSGKTMNCKRAGRFLDRYLDGELAPGRVNPLEKHLDGCPRCMDYLESSRIIRSAVRASFPGSEAGAAVVDRAWRRIEEGMGSRERPTLVNMIIEFWRWITFHPRPVWLSTFAAAALVAVLVMPFGARNNSALYSHPVIESLESRSSQVMVLMPEENPVTVIWFFEEGKT